MKCRLELTLEEYIEVRRAIATRLWFIRDFCKQPIIESELRVKVDEKTQKDYDEQSRILERVIQTRPELIKEKAHGKQIDKQ